MKKQQYKQDINASAEQVFNTMLGIDNKTTYEQWTAAFNPTSTYEGNWQKGAKMYFVGTDDTGKKGGMIAEIAALIPHQFVSIRHYGMLDGDKEITEGEEVEKWAGSLENYTLTTHNGVTNVTVELDVVEEHLDYFDETWPKALNRLKDLIEK
jgi:uncharacterized protein YndB with AHSA1/START domain